MGYITKKTEKIRYKFVALILRHLTPVLYDKIDLTTFTNKRVYQLKSDNIPNAIRPSIQFVKKIFDGKLIKGAEIGVERGKNSENILNELNIEKLYLIDIWQDYKETDINWSTDNYSCVLRKFRKDERVEIIKDYSKHAVHEIKDDSLDFVYIDANHKYNYIYQDISLWYPKIKEGGIIAGHDVMLKINDQHDVLNAVKNFCYERRINFYIKEPDWFFKKPK